MVNISKRLFHIFLRFRSVWFFTFAAGIAEITVCTKVSAGSTCFTAGFTNIRAVFTGAALTAEDGTFPARRTAVETHFCTFRTEIAVFTNLRTVFAYFIAAGADYGTSFTERTSFTK